MSETKNLTIRVTPEQFEAIVSMQRGLSINTMSKAIVYAATEYESMFQLYKEKCDDNATMGIELKTIYEAIRYAEDTRVAMLKAAHDSNL